jgi:hypothetical protein
MQRSAVDVQMARLFGASSTEAAQVERTPAQWRRTLKKVLDEVFRYTEANIDTDETHWFMILSCFAAANESLKESQFWPSYAEAITRLSLLLLGDYPDHRKRTSGKKKSDHYKLSRHRSLHYLQSEDQRLKVLFAAHALRNVGFPSLSVPPREALSEFRAEVGYSTDYRQFMRWYKSHYPNDYALLF